MKWLAFYIYWTVAESYAVRKACYLYRKLLGHRPANRPTTLPCYRCETKPATLCRIWSGADPVGRDEPICEECRQWCAAG